MGHVVFQQDDGRLLRLTAPVTRQAGRRKLAQYPPRHQTMQKVRIILNGMVSRRMGYNGGKAVNLELKQHLLGVERRGAETPLDQHVTRCIEGQGRAFVQLLDQVWHKEGLNARHDSDVHAIRVQRILHFSRQLANPRTQAGIHVAVVVGRGSHHTHAVGVGYPGHSNRLLQAFRTVIDTRENVRVQVNHRVGRERSLAGPTSVVSPQAHV